MRAALRSPWMMAAIGILAFLALVASLTTYQNVRTQNQERIELAKQNQEILREVKRSAERIDSCTTPEGECYKQSQERTREIFGEPRGPLNTVVVATSYCAQQPENSSIEDVRGCVKTTLRGGGSGG